MNVTRVTLQNFRSWDTLDLPLRPGCLAIIGPNGAGKSSILQAIDVGLFGGKLDRCLRRGATELEVAIEVTHGGDTYRVRRHYSARAKGKSGADFAVKRDGEWEALTLETQAATQGLIEDTLRLSRTTLRASAYLAQGDGGAFTEASPAARKAVLAEVLGLDMWDRLAELATTDRRAAEQALAAAKIVIGVHERDVADRVNVEAELTTERRELVKAEQQAAQTQVVLTQTLERDAQFRELQARFEAAEREVASLRDQHRALDGRRLYLNGQIAQHDTDGDRADALRREARSIPELQVAIDRITRDQVAWDMSREQAAQARADADREEREAARYATMMESLKAQAKAQADKRQQTEAGAVQTCGACGQPIQTQAARDQLVGAIDYELDKLRTMYADARQAAQEATNRAAAARARCEAPDTPRPDPLDAQAALMSAQDAAQKVAMIDGRAEQIGDLTSEREKANERLRELRLEIDAKEQHLIVLLHDRGPQRPDVAAVQRAASIAHQRVVGLTGRVASRETRLKAIDDAAVQLADAHRLQAQWQTEHDVCERLCKAFGRDGIPALIVETAAIPQIEAEAARILGELGAAYRVELRTQRALKSGDGLRDTLDIVVTTDNGEALYEDFSGGEKTRLNLALRIALARLLAHRHGADVRFLAIDEPEFLDAAGTDKLARVLKGLRGDFDTILMISHIPELRDAFDDVLALAPREALAA